MNKSIILHLLDLDLLERFEHLIITPCFQLNLINDFNENCINVGFDVCKRLLNFFLEVAEFLD